MDHRFDFNIFYGSYKDALFEFFHMAKNSILAKIQVLTKYIGAHELGQGWRNSDLQSGSICFHLLA